MLKSLKPFGLDKKVLIISIDKKCAAILSKLGYTVICINNAELVKFCPWNSSGYDKICYYKMELLYRLLSLKLNVLLVDGDIVFHKDPLHDIMKWQNDAHYDVWIQNDSQNNKDITNMCTGYMYIMPCMMNVLCLYELHDECTVCLHCKMNLLHVCIV